MVFDLGQAPRNVVLHDHFSFFGGGERVALALQAALDADLLTGFVHGAHTLQLLGSRAGSIESVALRLPIPLARALYLAARFQRLDLRRYDCGVFAGHLAPFALLGRRPEMAVVYCHTPPRYVFDQREHYGRRIPRPLRPAAAMLLRRFEHGYRRAMQGADLVIANSRNVQARLRSFVGVASEIIYPPVRTSAIRFLSDGDYYLSTARLDPLKRVDRLIEAFRRMPDKRLIVVSGGIDEPRLRHLAADAPNIRFIGWVSDAVLHDLLGRCIATLYIPVDEDFGISPVESMAAGKPVIGVREGGLTETIVDGETGWLLDPRLKQRDLVAAVRACTPQRSALMRLACERRAQLFSAERFESRLLAALAALAREKRLAAVAQPFEPKPTASLLRANRCR